MADMKITKCSYCGYVRNEGDAMVMDSICPSCRRVYKGQEAVLFDHDNDSSVYVEYEEGKSDIDSSPWYSQLFLTVPKKVDIEVWVGSAIIYVVFFIWGWSFILSGTSWQPIMNSFMHNINLPFHEFGHVLFIPFGRFMTILGGSLFQLLVPFIICCVFLIGKRDIFAASIALWWFGQNFIDLSPYIADATYRGLPLIAGMGESSHDWGNLLTMLDMLEYDYRIANISFYIGSLIMMVSMVWGGYYLFMTRPQGKTRRR